MDKTINHLVELSNRLDKEGKKTCADAVDGLILEGSVVKIAQYVGVIGYVLKQNRAMANCIRRKRAGTNTSMQDVVMSCLKEYQDGQDYNDKEWTGKYAQVLEQDPALFKQAHLVFLAELGKEGDIELHINNLEKTAALLEENGDGDEMLSKMLSHIKSYGEILQAETENVNFKMAAPRWWSRLWQNVNPWSKKWRERGEDKKTMSEMDNVLKNIIEVGDTTRQIQGSIQQLKSRFGSLQDLVEPTGQSQEIIKRINQLNTGNWNNLSSSVYQLQYMLQYSSGDMSDAAPVIEELAENVNAVNDSMRDIQINMNLLRQRAPIRGRYSKYTEEGKLDPRAIASPAEEFGVLDRVLSHLYKNPFDREAYFYAQRMHARLEDRLRYIEREPDQEAQDWLRTPETQEHGVQSQPGIFEPQQTIDLGPVDDRQINAVVQSLLQTNPVADTASMQEKADWLANLFTQVFATLKVSDHPKLKALKDALVDVSDRVGPTPSTSGLAPPSVSQSAPSTAVPEQEDIDLDAFSTSWLEDFDDIDEENNAFAQVSIEDLIKIANKIDPIDRNLATLIDKYIEESDLFELPEFPEHSFVIKCDGRKDTLNLGNTQNKKAGYVFNFA